MEIDPRYRIHLKGTYWAGINTCPRCAYQGDTVSEDIIGFANSQYGIMAVAECPKCFKRWHFHMRNDDFYESFKMRIKFGTQKYFKGTEGTPEDLPKLIKPGRQ